MKDYISTISLKETNNSPTKNNYYAASISCPLCFIAEHSMQQNTVEQEYDWSFSSEDDEHNLVHILEYSTDQRNISMNRFLKLFNYENVTFQNIFFDHASIEKGMLYQGG